MRNLLLKTGKFGLWYFGIRLAIRVAMFFVGVGIGVVQAWPH